jgi:hypothetical protein
MSRIIRHTSASIKGPAFPRARMLAKSRALGGVPVVGVPIATTRK